VLELLVVELDGMKEQLEQLLEEVRLLDPEDPDYNENKQNLEDKIEALESDIEAQTGRIKELLAEAELLELQLPLIIMLLEAIDVAQDAVDKILLQIKGLEEDIAVLVAIAYGDDGNDGLRKALSDAEAAAEAAAKAAVAAVGSMSIIAGGDLTLNVAEGAYIGTQANSLGMNVGGRLTINTGGNVGGTGAAELCGLYIESGGNLVFGKNIVSQGGVRITARGDISAAMSALAPPVI